MENYKLKKLYKNLRVFIKMNRKFTKFGDTEIEKQKFHKYKSLFW